MTEDVHLQDFLAIPLYNIKAVEQSTGISASTLRAWERRYNVCRPHRAASGYRLYSDRDIAMIGWLKTQVDVGMSISQAVAKLENLIEEAGSLAQVMLPGNRESVTAPPTSAIHHLTVRNYTTLQTELLQALMAFDETTAEHLLAEAFALYPMELIGENLIAPVLVEIGERWHRGEVTVTREHYASTLLQQQLAAVLRTVPHPNKKFLIWVACVPGEEHEIGALLLTIYLRRAGYQAQYLGKNIMAADLVSDVGYYQPALILLSAATEASAERLRLLAQVLNNLTTFRPIIGYGGRIFQQQPTLRNEIMGVYMGDSAYEAVANTEELLGVPSDSKPKPLAVASIPSFY